MLSEVYPLSMIPTLNCSHLNIAKKLHFLVGFFFSYNGLKNAGIYFVHTDRDWTSMRGKKHGANWKLLRLKCLSQRRRLHVVSGIDCFFLRLRAAGISLS